MQHITRNSTHRTWALQPITLAVAMLCHSAMAADATTSAKEHQLQTVEVSASGLGWEAAEMAAPVSVLDGEVWQLRRSATLGDSLDGEPGIHATHFGAGASRPIIRGMDGPRVGVLANGMELHDASTLSPDHAVVAEPLLARQVEILRGPAALPIRASGLNMDCPAMRTAIATRMAAICTAAATGMGTTTMSTRMTRTITACPRWI